MRFRCRSLVTLCLLGVLGSLLSGAIWASGSAAPADPPTTAVPQLVQNTGAGEKKAAKQLTATFGSPTTAGHLLVLSASVYTGTTNRITSVTDSAGGRWVRAGSYASAGHNSDGELWYCADAAAVSQVTAHLSSAGVLAISVQEFSGVATQQPLDGASGQVASNRAPTSGQRAAPAPGLALGFIAGHGNPQPIAVTSAAYTTQPQQTSAANQVASVVTGYQVLPAASATAFTGSLARSMYWSAGVAVFKAAPLPDDFSVSADPVSAVVPGGHQVSVTVGTTVISGYPQPVALSVSGLPQQVTARFEPAGVSTGQGSTLTITTSISALPGTYPLTITATGTAAPTSPAHSTLLSVTVGRPAAIRAAFYYPWFPQAWVQQGQNPFTNYYPGLGLYSIDVPTVTGQVADLQYGGISLGLASWFGQGSTTDKHWPALFQAAQGTGFSWAPYYEPEGISDPTPQQIADDLHYLRSTYGGPGSALAELPGKGMPVFVYNTDDPTQAKGCDTIDRWTQARGLLSSEYGESVYVDLKVFPGYRTCPGTPSVDGWHQYGPASALQDFSTAPGDGSFSISPGYWKSGIAYGVAPFLPRDRSTWQASIATMTASKAPWQLVTTYNEWGEGTAVESSTGCRTDAPAGTYCDWSGGGAHSDFLTDLHNTPVG